MTELQQELLNELEKLESSRNAERAEYEQSLKTLSEQMAKQYSDSLTDIMNSEDSDSESLVAYLQMLTEQQSRIIKLLETPPKGEDTAEKLKPILGEFFATLEANLTASNSELIEQINNSLHSLESE